MDIVDELSNRIAGEITLSDTPSKTLKKWRELFGLTQSELARYINTSPSVVSDYESGRRNSPGTRMVKKFVEAVISADSEKGHPVAKAYEKSNLFYERADVIIDIRDFASPVSAGRLCEAVKGRFVFGREYSDVSVYGYTVVDSIKAILEFSSEEFMKLYGTTSQRALVFTKVSYGRSPLIAVRVSSLKPKVVVMHGVKEIDVLGLKIAQKERIPIILCEPRMRVEEMLKSLRRCVE